MVAFCNIESEIYEKAKEKVADLTVDNASEDEDDDDDELNDCNGQEEEGSPADEGLVFDLDGDVNLESAFLRGLLSDVRASPTLESVGVVATELTHREMRDHEPTEDDWENM